MLLLLLLLPVKCHPQQLSVLGTANTAKSLKLFTIKNRLKSRVLFARKLRTLCIFSLGGMLVNSGPSEFGTRSIGEFGTK